MGLAMQDDEPIFYPENMPAICVYGVHFHGAGRQCGRAATHVVRTRDAGGKTSEDGVGCKSHAAMRALEIQIQAGRIRTRISEDYTGLVEIIL